jgi:hypothetical protein
VANDAGGVRSPRACARPERLQARTMAAVQFPVRARHASPRRPLWRHPCKQRFRQVHADCQDPILGKG